MAQGLLAAALLLMLQGHLCESRLLMVHSLTRHGSRAPNEVVSRLCPAIFPSREQILLSFGVAPGMLTARGMGTLRKVGEWMRLEYVDKLSFVSGDFFKCETSMAFSAIAEDRHLSSVAAIGQGLFPGIAVPIYSTPGDADNRLRCPPAFCAAETHKQIVDWVKSHMADYLMKNESSRSVVEMLGKVCGRKIDPLGIDGIDNPAVGNPHPEFQDLVDMFCFMHSQGLPLPKQVTPTVLRQTTDIAFEAMIDRLFREPHSVVRFCGEFPSTLQSNILKMVSHLEGQLSLASPKFFVDVSSRELLYALSSYYGFHFQIPGEPAGFIMPGTSIIWELHGPDKPEPESGDGYFVMAFYYYPSDPNSSSKLLQMKNCPPKCPLHQFLEIHKGWLHQVGHFDDLCPAQHVSGETKKQAKKALKTDKKMNKKELKAFKKKLKLKKKAEEVSMRAQYKAEKVLRREAKTYVNIARHSCSARPWDSHIDVVHAFCQACQDHEVQCGADVLATSMLVNVIGHIRFQDVVIALFAFIVVVSSVLFFIITRRSWSSRNHRDHVAPDVYQVLG